MNLSDLCHPNQLRELSVPQLARLAQQIRQKHLETVAATGGHLGPGLGVVELTLGLYKTLDLDRDRVVWDVGHQAYPHKMLTGRYANFHTLRQKDGIAGYLKRAENPFDCWGAGHASTSISAALGMALARDFQGLNRKVVAVIGDGALTGGMALEALNHAGHLAKTNLMVILNDNEMSISENVGGLSLYLNRLRTDPALRQLRSNLESQLFNFPLLGSTFSPEFERFKDSLKYMTMTRSKAGVIFEELGFTYLGPIDGHNLSDLIETFEFAHNLTGPVFVHVITVKGKGYEVAERNQVTYHAQNAFDLTTGKAKPSSKPTPPAYTSVFASTLLKLAEQNEKIVGITAAMPTGTGLDKFKERFADRYFDVGIAEQHAVTMAAGLAAEGMRPVAAIYSTFLQRAFDQIVHDVAIQDLPVFFCLDRAGVVGEDGPTHHGVFDLAYLRQIPGMVVMAPKDEAELQRMLVTGVQYTKGPIAVRYPRGAGVGAPLMAEGWEAVPVGKAEVLRTGDDLLIVAIGSMVHPSLQAAALLSEHGIAATVVNARFAKPLDTELILPLARRIARVVTVEEGCRTGGFGSAVLEALMDAGLAVPTLRIGIDDRFVTHASRSQLLEMLGLTPTGIAQTIQQSLNTQPAAQPQP
ncbi:1-deoxy-D-xylulose-5-phosphate synthase [Gloeobacter kilaueensis]|uniref:1-deoxy-D-xylulose-5-phosphate synthase n=1 Tax=Gloeobacter kilaueensis (strain ATCC BAA-2537 / CCAP 1431/1 / ULC 316 / JS1) TaxID=1183438 RepID=U5QM48_GLOK1|nr:1-deoxy-D-xylulose-5-phosphate synthase [Gloeobacter kilaueensis]AGY58750.1 1-deoxy-D-xylulose-5-phosphate synthase [Gloeobacter kilaueensis JS1]